MDLQLSDEQQQLVDAFAALYAKSSTTTDVRAAEAATGFDEDLWALLTDTGALHMAVPEKAGGWSAELLDLALVAEQHGRFLAAAPTIEIQVAARLLARLDADAARVALNGMLDGEGLVTFAVRGAHDHHATLVPAGAIAQSALVLDGDRLLLTRLAERTTRVPNIADLPLADIVIESEAIELAVGASSRSLFDFALDEWCTLTASSLVGVAERALEIGVEYATERSAFGQPIGGFQAVAHRLADVSTAIDGARLLARQAAWAHAEQPDRFGELAAMSLAFAAQTARDSAYWGLHFHGGYGFMLEYDIQLFFRRAWGWAGVLGDLATTFDRIADRRYGPRSDR